MKNLKVITLAIAILGFSAASFAQTVGNTSNASANASAYIVEHIEITKQSGKDLVFGNIIGSATGGTVTVNPAGEASYGTGTKLSAVGSLTTTSAAGFTVTGQTDAVFTIVLPTSSIIQIGTTSDQMTVNNFKSSITNLTAVTLTGGTIDFNVGADLIVGAKQKAGLYEGTFDVTVNYN